MSQPKVQNTSIEPVFEILEHLGVRDNADWAAVVFFARNLVQLMEILTEEQKARLQARVFEEMAKKPLDKKNLRRIVARIERSMLESPPVEDLRAKLRSEEEGFSQLYHEMRRVMTDIAQSSTTREERITTLGRRTEAELARDPDPKSVLKSLRGMITDLVSQAREDAKTWEERARLLERTANFDTLLSELYCRRAFDAALVEGTRRAEEQHKPLCLLFIDVDHFKDINDRHGHLAGDNVLRVLAAIVSAHAVQFGGFAARYGGEELVVLCEGLDEDAAAFHAEALRLDVERCPFLLPQEDGQPPAPALKVTVSVGVAQLGASQQSTELVLLADKAMYAAKSRGRNQVVRASELAPAAPATPL